MEVFLLIVILVLLVAFNVSRNSKINAIDEKLLKIEDYLRKIQFVQSQNSSKSNPVKNEEPAKPPVAEITPSIPEVSIKQEPQKVEPAVFDKKPQPIITNESKPEIKVSEPVKSAIQSINSKPVETPSLSWYESFRKNNPDIEKFIGENILSKVAITVLVIGVAFFVKLAIDKDWINEVARVGIGILCGAIILGFAHRLHKNFKSFSSVLVAGGISIFYFTVGIAFHQYHLFGEGSSGQTIAFVLMLGITAFSVFISIVYDRVELAALSLIGGFATPFMVSTGQGNYQVLFTYVLILDVGMLVLAYLRKWNVINVMTYLFTMALFFGWLQTKCIGSILPPYKGALIFDTAFYILFIVMNIVNNIKEKRKFGVLELSILISNTFLFYGISMQILSNYHPELKGLYSLLMALFNLICSWLLYKKFKADEKLVYLMIGLTLTFITLIAPVQLQGNYITIFWALETVLLIWLAQKSNIVLYRLASVLITVLMSFSLFMDWANVYLGDHQFALPVLFNKGFITGIVSSLSLLALVLLLRKETETVKYLSIPFNPKGYSKFLTIVFLVFLYFTGLFELVYHLNETIVFGATITIIVVAYHLLYFSMLNIVASKIGATIYQVPMYIFNFINSGLFVLFFTTFPIMDFKENFMNGDTVYVGFIFHYLSLACFVFMAFSMNKATSNPLNKIMFNKALNTILISIAVIYISSSELVLHVLKLTLKNNPELMDIGGTSKYILYETTKTHIVKIGFPILWGILAFLFLFIGMKKANKTFRVIALILIAVTLIKLFSYDIQDASQAGKIVAFIILGVVLLIISFMYQKIKALLSDDTVVKDSESKNAI